MTANSHTGPHRVDLPEWISPAPFERLLGMEIVKAEAGAAILRMPFRGDLAQGAGLMHGGALVSLADTAVVMAIKSIVAPGGRFVTISLESRFLHPVQKGIVTARAVVDARRGLLLDGTCEIFDDSGRPVMRFASVFKLAGDAAVQDLRPDHGDKKIPAGR